MSCCSSCAFSGAGLGLVLLAFVLALVFELLLVLLALGILVVFGINLVGVVAQLVAVAQIFDHAAGEAGEGFLVFEEAVDIGQRVPCLSFDEIAPQRGDVFGGRGQVAAVAVLRRW